MTSPPTPEQFDEAFSKSHELDPSPEFWGLFAYSDAPPNVCGSGLGSFQWFATRAELVDFVRDAMAWWNPAPSSMTPEELAESVQSIVAAQFNDLSKLRDSLNDAMKNMWHIEWWGQLNELCESDAEFPSKVRQNFLDDQELDSPTTDEFSPVGVEQIDDFKECLRDYGV